MTAENRNLGRKKFFFFFFFWQVSLLWYRFLFQGQLAKQFCYYKRQNYIHIQLNSGSLSISYSNLQTCSFSIDIVFMESFLLSHAKTVGERGILSLLKILPHTLSHEKKLVRDRKKKIQRTITKILNQSLTMHSIIQVLFE